jgi:hypothetical protein
MSSPNGKDVVYIDVDDEITGVIDKVTSANAKVVALVLPKRATVFQSIVNMKLLKKRAEAAKKNIVLITSEAGLMPMAGVVGLYVAPTLQSKPEIPDASAATSEMPEDVDEGPVSMGGDFDATQAGGTPVGKLAASQEPSIAKLSDDDDGSFELDNSELPEGDTEGDINALAAAGGSGKAAKQKKDKHLKVPNFNRFRMLIFGFIGLIILLIIAFFVANRILPKAQINVKTNTSSVNANLSPTLDTNATTVDLTKDTIPAQTQQQTKTSTEQVAASGKQNNGVKATGGVTLSIPCSDVNFASGPPTVPAGAGLSNAGLTFITQSATQLSNQHGSIFDPNCTFSGATNVTAQQGGSQYNVNNGTFTVAGSPNITGSGSTSGGTDNIVTVVQQADIDAATNKLKNDMNADAVKTQLEQNLQSNGLYPIQATFFSSTPNISPSVQAGTQADNVTVTESITYTMYGAKQSDIQTVLDGSINSQIDTSKQSIQDDGLSQSAFSVPSPGTGNTLDISLQTTATIGPHMNLASLKSQVEGKRSGDIKTYISSLPGVTDVQVKLSPFWVSSAPKNPSKITIKFEK